jgi:hypothetical protein
MNGFLRLLLVFTLSLALVSCATTQDGDSNSSSAMSQEDFEDFDNSADAGAAEGNSEASLEDELNLADDQPTVKSEPANGKMEDEFAEFDNQPAPDISAEIDLPPDAPPAPEIQAETTVETVPAPIVETEPQPEAPIANSASGMVKLTNIKYTEQMIMVELL